MAACESLDQEEFFPGCTENQEDSAFVIEEHDYAEME